jgi:hypothetical protein
MPEASLKIEFGPSAVLFGAGAFLYCQGIVWFDAYKIIVLLYFSHANISIKMPLFFPNFNTYAYIVILHPHHQTKGGTSRILPVSTALFYLALSYSW